MKNLRFFAYGLLILSPLIFGASYYRGYERGVVDKAALTERATQAESAGTTAQKSADDLKSLSGTRHATIIKLNRKIQELENKAPRVVTIVRPPTTDPSSSSNEECKSGFRQGYKWGIAHQGTWNVVDAPPGSSDSYRQGFSVGVTSGQAASFHIDVSCHT